MKKEWVWVLATSMPKTECQSDQVTQERDPIQRPYSATLRWSSREGFAQEEAQECFQVSSKKVSKACCQEVDV